MDVFVDAMIIVAFLSGITLVAVVIYAIWFSCGGSGDSIPIPQHKMAPPPPPQHKQTCEKEAKAVLQKPINTARIIQVVQLEFIRGTGSSDDKYRMVTQYWTIDGKLIAELDDKTA